VPTSKQRLITTLLIGLLLRNIRIHTEETLRVKVCLAVYQCHHDNIFIVLRKKIHPHIGFYEKTITFAANSEKIVSDA
jgi:hypothetical protein